MIHPGTGSEKSLPAKILATQTKDMERIEGVVDVEPERREGARRRGPRQRAASMPPLASPPAWEVNVVSESTPCPARGRPIAAAPARDEHAGARQPARAAVNDGVTLPENVAAYIAAAAPHVGW